MYCKWTAVCVAVPNKEINNLIEKEFELLRQLDQLQTDELVIVEDACQDVGSAGSALNALLITVERLCARRGYQVLHENVLETSKILIILLGHESNAFKPLSDPAVWSTSPNTVICKIIKNITMFARNTINGVWITGTNSIFTLNEPLPNIVVEPDHITAFSFKGDTLLAKTHGSYILDEQGKFKSLSYCISDDEKTKEYNITLGLLYFPPMISIAFLRLHSYPPISATTYHGIDTGTIGMKLSLFFDLVQSSVLNEQEFMKNDFGLCKIERNIENRRLARGIIHKKFCNFHSKIVCLDIKNYEYLMDDNDIHVETDDNRKKWMKSLITKIADYEKPCESLMEIILKIDIIFDSKYLSSVIEALKTSLAQGNPSDTMKLACTFSRMADLMMVKSKGDGGIKSGPAANPDFSEYFHQIRTAENEVELQDVCKRLFDFLHSNWFSSPILLVRGSRHSDAAVQLLISRLVLNEYKSVCNYPSVMDSETSKSENLPENVRVNGAARIDLCGGWLDTPPITFMVNNPAVINMAVLFENQHPLHCFVQRFSIGIGIEIIVEGMNIHLHDADHILQLARQPTQAGSLICACIVAIGLITSSTNCVKERIECFYSCTKLVIECGSILAHGSGMGTSSILAACIVRALLEAAGFTNLGNKKIVYIVLYVEQILTTGGGWQDQVGGIYPGIKYSILKKKEFSVQNLQISPKLEEEINRRLVLIHTGNTRLAKNLLQEVIRGWYSGSHVRLYLNELQSIIPKFEEELVKNGRFPTELVEKYFFIKKQLAPGCVPNAVAELIDILEKNKISKTCWFAGAGGGGYLCVWLSENMKIQNVKDLFENLNLVNFEVFNCKLSYEPITYQYNISNSNE